MATPIITTQGVQPAPSSTPVNTSAVNPSPTNPSPTNMDEGIRYSFFLNDGTKGAGDYPKLYATLIASAQTKIVVWDGYIHQPDMELIKNISHPVSLILLTSCSSQNWSQKRDALLNELKQQVPVGLKPDVSVQIGYIDRSVHGQDKWNCHDRFLIIDDTEYYLIGSSMAHHRELHSSTGILHIEHSDDKDVIQKAFDKVYDEAMTKGWISSYQNLN